MENKFITLITNFVSKHDSVKVECVPKDESNELIVKSEKGDILFLESYSLSDDIIEEVNDALSFFIKKKVNNKLSDETWKLKTKIYVFNGVNYVCENIKGSPIGDKEDLISFKLRKGTGKTGAIVCRLQPPQKGHIDYLFKEALKECDIVNVGLGSTQLKGVMRHPFSFEQRKEMLMMCLTEEERNRIRIIPLIDLNCDDVDLNNGTELENAWSEYVFGKFVKQGLPEVDIYYAGSIADASWYIGYLLTSDYKVNTNNHITTYESNVINKKVKVIDRTQTLNISATDVRSLIERRNDLWKEMVPEAIVDYIEDNYPVNLRVPKSSKKAA